MPSSVQPKYYTAISKNAIEDVPDTLTYNHEKRSV